MVCDLDSILIFTNKTKHNKLIALDRSTGNELWTLRLSDKNQSLARINSLENKPEYVYAVTDSLYRIEVSTGKNIRRHFHSYHKSETFLGKSYMGLHSDFWSEGDSLFIADADSLYCFDTDLRSIWQTALPKDVVARSGIWNVGDSIKLFSPGWALVKNIYRDNYTGPFAASFDIKTGKTLTTTFIDKKDSRHGVLLRRRQNFHT